MNLSAPGNEAPNVSTASCCQLVLRRKLIIFRSVPDIFKLTGRSTDSAVDRIGINLLHRASIFRAKHIANILCPSPTVPAHAKVAVKGAMRRRCADWVRRVGFLEHTIAPRQIIGVTFLEESVELIIQRGRTSGIKFISQLGAFPARDRLQRL